MSRKSENQQQTQARLRTEIILKVTSGQMTATEGAKKLGVSRKTYYKWEARALAAMMEAVEDKSAGRHPPSEDAQKAKLLEAQLEQRDRKIDLLERKMELKDLIDDFFRSTDGSASEKK